MSLNIEVFVQGTPKGQPRPRAFSRGGKASVYNPATAEGWKSEIAHALRKWSNIEHTGPVSVTLVCTFKRPASHFIVRKGIRASLKLRAPKWHTQKPDGDNLAKAVLDTCSQIGIWKDDAQVVTLVVHKIWSMPTPKGGGQMTPQGVLISIDSWTYEYEDEPVFAPEPV